MGSEYECVKPPCVHVVLDWRRKMFAVFVEDAEGSLLYVPSEELLAACEKVREAMSKKVREASGDEIDELAEEHLNAVEVVEEG